MHYLFTKVLSRRDLSRAGDLFSVADSEIVDDLTDVLAEIDTIISQSDYQHNTNDQSVVEICVTRVLSCLRETKTAERHCSGLVALLSTCLQHNLKPTTAHKVDPPHAKISADIISSIFLVSKLHSTFRSSFNQSFNPQNYNKKPVMQIALPVAVKFLQKGNAELSRNLASYLSLAAIEYATLLGPHVQPILDSICTDANYGLCRLLSQIYEVAPEQLIGTGTGNVTATLVLLLPRCDIAERLALLQLFALIARQRPAVLAASVPQLCEHLGCAQTAMATMQVLLPLAELGGPATAEQLAVQFGRLRTAAQETPATVTLAAQIMAAAGKVNKVRFFRIPD